MTTKNILIFVHGMMPEDIPHSPISVYNQLWDSVKNLDNTLGQRVDFEDIVEVQWGHYDARQSPDEKINIAERFIAEKIDNKILAENTFSSHLFFFPNNLLILFIELNAMPPNLMVSVLMNLSFCTPN